MDDLPAFFFEILKQKVPPAFSFHVIWELVPDFSDTVISTNADFFLQLACGFIEQDFGKAGGILHDVLVLKQDPATLSGVAKFCLDKLHSGNVTESEVGSMAFLIADLIKAQLADIGEIQNIVALVKAYPEKTLAFSGFEELIDQIPDPLLAEMMKTTLEWAIEKMTSEEAIGFDDLDFCGEVMKQKENLAVVSPFITELAGAGDVERCIALYLTSLVITCRPSIGEDPGRFKELLTASLQSEQLFVRNAVLEMISAMKLDTISADVTPIFPDIINEILDMLSRTPPDNTQMSLAMLAMCCLCDCCDQEIEGLMQRVWPLSGMVSSESGAAAFVRLCACIVKLTEDCDDEFLGEVVDFLGKMLQTGDPEIQAESLTLVAAVLSKDESMSELLLPPCTSLFEPLLKYENKEVVGTTAAALGTISEILKEQAVPLIQPVLALLLGLIEVDGDGDTSGPADDALSAASCFATYSGNLELIAHLCGICLTFLKETEKPHLQDAACRALCRLGKSEKIAEVPVIGDIYAQLVQMLLGPYDIEDVGRIFGAAGLVFKRARRVNEQVFNEMAIQVIRRWLSESVNGQNICQHPQLVTILDDVMIFMGRVLKTGISGADEICSVLLQAIPACGDNVKFCILGALTDAVEYCPVTEETVGNICQFVLSAAPTINETDFRQNTAYFVGMLIRKYPQHIEIGRRFMPFIQQWWSSGLSKKSGHEELLVNCASFFLTYANADPTALSEEMFTAALKRFPPTVDVRETDSMLAMICSILQTRGGAFSERIHGEIALSLAKLFTEPEWKFMSRRIPSERVEIARQLLKTEMGNGQINNYVRSFFQKKRAKAAALEKALSM